MNISNLVGPDAPDQYQNFTFLGRGGMGEVYIANDTINKLKVAIKFIREVNYADSLQLESEFTIAQSLNHPNIVRTYYANRAIVDGDNYFYAVMEYIDGVNLMEHLRHSQKPIPLEDVLTIMLQLAAGLAVAHEIIVHRDLKPENILLSATQTVKICDFGISKIVLDSTRTNTFKGWGTDAYMSPEGWMLDTNTPSMDVYSAGIIFFELLTGQKPYSARTPHEFRDKHIYESFPDILKIRADVPIKLAQIIGKMVSKRAMDRYKNGKEVYDALLRLNSISSISTDSPDSILKKANQKIQQNQQAELRRQKEQHEDDARTKLLNYSIDSLFTSIRSIIETINESLELKKIIVSQSGRKLTLSFFNKNLVVRFFSEDAIQSYIDSKRENNIRSQEEKYGMIMNSPPETHLSKDGVKLIGLIGSEPVPHGSYPFGANLVLLKPDPNDLYGFWYACWFDDSALSNQSFRHYPLEGSEFFREYEFGRGRVMHVRTMEFEPLKDNLLHKLIEYLVE